MQISKKKILLGKSHVFLVKEKYKWLMNMRKMLDFINNQEKLKPHTWEFIILVYFSVCFKISIIQEIGEKNK